MTTPIDQRCDRPIAILKAGHELLRQPCSAWSPALLPEPALAELLRRMRLTLRKAKGVGLAANQVNLGLQVIVIHDRAIPPPDAAPDLFTTQGREPVPFYGLVNPAIDPADDEITYWFEACLSIRGYTAVVPRHSAVRVSGLTPKGEVTTFEAKGWHARILQHEVDHLRGVLYVDRMLERTFMSKDSYRATWRSQPMAEVLAALGCSTRTSPA